MFERGGIGVGWVVIGRFTEVDLVTDEDAGEVWVRMFSHVCKPRTRVDETCVWEGYTGGNKETSLYDVWQPVR